MLLIVKSKTDKHRYRHPTSFNRLKRIITVSSEKTMMIQMRLILKIEDSLISNTVKM